VILPLAASASAVTFATSLPVGQDQVIVRFNAQPSFSTHQLNSFQFPISIGYGLTTRISLFAGPAQGFVATNSGTARIRNGGAGDTSLYARYTIYKIDKPGLSFRIAPLAGAFLPTGSNSFTFQGKPQSKSLQTGSGTVDAYGGISAGLQYHRFSANADATYRYNPLTTTNFSLGSELRLDGQVEYKFWPFRMPAEGLPHVANFSLESNYYADRMDHWNGVVSPNSGGRIFRESAILQLSSLRWQVGAGVQLPLLQHLNGTGRTTQKIGYLMFFEYYLAAPIWRKSARRHA
jgi:hypothetical protein